MIIAVSGKIKSGKDEVGKIWRYLSSYICNIDGLTYKEWIDCEMVSNIELKKFADKPKDMVCMILGCTRAQLDDREYQDTELGEEWAICKNSETNEIHSWFDIRNFQYRNGDIYRNVFRLENGTKFNGEIVKLTPRLVMQKFLTEGGREGLHPDVWTNTLMRDYNSKSYSYERRVELAKTQGLKVKDDYWYDQSTIEMLDLRLTGNLHKESKWIITDLRFPNELEAITSRGGVTIRINRNNGTRAVDIHNHISETALDNAEFDYVIENDGTLEELVEKVRVIYKLVNK